MHQALEIPELLERILSYVFAITVKPGAMPWMTSAAGPSDLSQHPHLNLNPLPPLSDSAVCCNVAYPQARLVCRRWNAVYEQMSRLRLTRWVMTNREAEERRLGLPHQVALNDPFDLKRCQRLELFIYREPYGYETEAQATIERRATQWNNLLAALTNASSSRSKGADTIADKSSLNNHGNESSTSHSDTTTHLVRQPSQWRRCTGATIRELCIRGMGGMDSYLHSILRISQTNLGITLLDIRLNFAIRFNLHVLLIDHEGALLPNLQHLFVYGAVLAEPLEPMSSSELANSTPTTALYHNQASADDDGPGDGAILFDDLLPFELKPLQQQLPSSVGSQDEEEEGEDSALIKRKLRTFHLCNCDISKTYLLWLLRHIDRRHLQSLALNGLSKRIRLRPPQYVWSTAHISFFGSSKTQSQLSDEEYDVLLLQMLQWQLQENLDSSSALEGGGGSGATQQNHRKPMGLQQAQQRFRRLHADVRHLFRRFPNLNNISLHASVERDVHPLDAMLLLRSYLLRSSNNSVSIDRSGVGKNSHDNHVETSSVDCWSYHHSTSLSSFLVNRSLTRLEIAGNFTSSLSVPLLRLAKFLASDQARHLKEFVAPDVYYLIEYVLPPPVSDDDDEDKDEDEEVEAEEEENDGEGVDETQDSKVQGNATNSGHGAHQTVKKTEPINQVQEGRSSARGLLAGCFSMLLRGSSTHHNAHSSAAKKQKKPKKKSNTTFSSSISSFSSSTHHPWTCRGLERLEISFTSKFHGSTSLDRSSRAMFGFIASSLPALRHLSLRQEYSVLGIDGGLVLLTRLRDLEHLELQTRNFRHWGAWDDNAVVGRSGFSASLRKHMRRGRDGVDCDTDFEKLSWLKPDDDVQEEDNGDKKDDHGLWVAVKPSSSSSSFAQAPLALLPNEGEEGSPHKAKRKDSGSKTVHKKTRTKPARMSSLALARRVALLDHRGGHFAKGPARAMLWGPVAPAKKPIAAVTSSSSPSPSSSPGLPPRRPHQQQHEQHPMPTTPHTHGCCWRRMRRIIYKYEHGWTHEIDALRDSVRAVRPDLELTMEAVRWCSE